MPLTKFCKPDFWVDTKAVRAVEMILSEDSPSLVRVYLESVAKPLEFEFRSPALASYWAEVIVALVNKN